MAKVRCRACQNEKAAFCVVKQISVAINKPRVCEAFLLAEGKVKARPPVRARKLGYVEHQRRKAEAKIERAELMRLSREQSSDGVVKALGSDVEVKPGDSHFNMPSGNSKHPLTGDLSRFKTTAIKPENTHASKVKV